MPEMTSMQKSPQKWSAEQCFLKEITMINNPRESMNGALISSDFGVAINKTLIVSQKDTKREK